MLRGQVADIMNRISFLFIVGLEAPRILDHVGLQFFQSLQNE
jgi:hypothetical protein